MPEPAKTKKVLSRRDFLRVSAATTIGGLLAACAPLPQEGAQAPAAEPQTGAVPEAPAAEPAAPQAVNLRVRSFLDPKGPSPREQAFGWLLEEFPQRNPGLTVTIETLPFDQLDTKLIVENEAGTAPDVSYLSPQLIAKHVAAGSLLPLDTFIEGMGREWRDQFYSEGLWNQTVVGGHKYTMSIGAHTRVLYTRKDFFREAGLEEDAIPETLDELVDMAKTLTKDRTYGLGFSLGPTRGTAEIYWNAILWGRGGRNLDEEGKAAFNSPEGVETLEWLRGIVKTHKITPEEVLAQNYTEFSQGFPEGRYAMILDGSYRLSGWRALGLDETNMGAGLFPSPDGTPAPIFTNSWDLGMPSSIADAKQDAAWRFISFYFEPDVNLRYVDAEGSVPPIQSLLEEEAFQTPWHRVFGEAIAKVGRPLDATPFISEMNDLITNAIQNAILNDIPSQEALDEAAKAYNELAGNAA